jgi:hypothetical protein
MKVVIALPDHGLSRTGQYCLQPQTRCFTAPGAFPINSASESDICQHNSGKSRLQAQQPETVALVF